MIIIRQMFVHMVSIGMKTCHLLKMNLLWKFLKHPST